jgi:hypothetical protein
MTYEPTLTSYTDANPMPRVEVLFSSFDPDTAYVTVYRLAEGREYKVRGAVKAPTVGSLTRIDAEVPFGIPATYRAEMFDSSGASLGFTGTASITVNSADTWVHNPLDPSGGVRVTFLASAGRDISRPVDGSIFYPLGRRVGVVISGQRRGLSGVVLDCLTQTREEADKFAALVGSYSATTVPVMCFRPASTAQIRIPRVAFIAVLDPREKEINVRTGGAAIEWGIIGDEVSPPAAGIIIPLLTRADINAYYASNAAIAADNLTRLAVNRRYDLAGTAG